MGMTCTNQGTTTKTIAEMTPKERAVLFLSFYNQEYADYKVQIAMGNLTEAAKETLRTKKGILTRVYPFIQSYDLAVAEGRTPEATLMPMIIGLLNQIGAKIQ
jgi:hypothetical protein